MIFRNLCRLRERVFRVNRAVRPNLKNEFVVVIALTDTARLNRIQVKICKVCNATLKNVARKEARMAKAAAAAETPPAEAPATEEAQA